MPDALPQLAPDLAVPVTESDHARGPADAAVTLVEYGDYECPYCLAEAPIADRLRADFGGRVRFVFRHFPLNSVHAHASAAAQAAEAAGGQGKFWAMHDLLFARQADLAEVDLSALAIKAGVELYQFEADRSSGRYAARVGRDAEGGRAGGVTGTPTFFVNGRRVTGPVDEPALRAAITAAMAGATSATITGATSAAGGEPD